MKLLHKLWRHVGTRMPSGNPIVVIDGGRAPSFLDPELVKHVKSLAPSGHDTEIKLPGGPLMLMPREMIEYIQSRKPQPSRESIDKMLKRAKSFRAIEGGVSGDNPLGSKILFEASDQKMLADLRHFLQIVDGPVGRCMCHGDTTVECLDKSGKRLATIGLYHGRNIRWSAWKDDAALVDGLGLLKWLTTLGIQYPLQNYLDSRNRRAAEEADWKRWLAAMPPCLQPLLADQSNLLEGLAMYQPSPDSPRPTPDPQNITVTAHMSPERWIRVRQALQDAYPDSVQRSQVLFRWFGQVGCPWNGFAVYVEIAEALLMGIPIEDLLGALHGPSLPQPLLEGAVRFLAGWNFLTARGAELYLLPADLRQQLLEYGLQTQAPGRHAFLQRCFNATPPR